MKADRLRVRALLLAVAATMAAACGPSGAGVLEVPLPARFEDLEPALRARVRAAADALEASPRSTNAWLELGMTYEANALNELALTCYSRALGLEPSGRAWHRVACVEAQLGEPEAAAKAMGRSLELEPDYAPSHWRLGSYLFDLGQFDGAEQSFREALRHDERFMGGPLGIVRVRLQRDDPQTALRILEAALTRRPDEPHALRLLRTALQLAGRPEEALAVPVVEGRFPAFGRDPWNRQLNDYRERPPMEQALDLLQRGRAAEALEVLESFVREQPDDLNAQAYLAQAYASSGRVPEALAVAGKALEREPDSLLVLRVLAAIQETGGQLDEALGTLERIVEIAPNDLESWLRKARLESTAGKREQALASLRWVYGRDRRAPRLLVQIGGLELGLGEPQAAIESFEAARTQGVAENALVLGLARAYAQVGRVAEARSLLEATPELGRAGAVLLEELADGEAERRR